MKILYVGTERDEAQAVATAARHLGESVSVSWTSRLDQVAKWTDETSGPRALVVEADPNGPAWRSVLAYAAGHTALPVVVVVPEGPLPLALGAYECIARTPSLLRDLPAAITRAIDRKRQPQPSSLPRLVKSADRTALDTERDSDRLERLQRLVEGERAARADLEQRLAHATAAVQEAESRHQLAMAAAAEQLARSQSQYEVGMARAAATRDMVDEQFREAAIEVERARRSHASAAAEAERLLRREAQLSALVDAATTARAGLEQRLADAESALGEGEARAAEERRTIAALLAERQRELQGTIAEEIDKRRGVEETLAHALSAGDAAEERHGLEMAAAAAQSRDLQAALSAARQELESKAADLKALAAREAELTSMLAAATASIETIERRLEATKGTLRETEARAGRELLAGEQAAARAAKLEEQLRQERAALATTSNELAERQAHFARERAQAESARAGLTEQLQGVAEARDQARRDHQSAAADVARLTERATELEGRLKEERTTRDGLEQAVAAAAVALRDERQQLGAALVTASNELADRQAHFDRERAQAESAHAALTEQLRAVKKARDQARREHQSAVADVARLTEREAVLSSEMADRQADFAHERAQAQAAHAGLTTELRAVEEARDQARREHQSAVADVARLAEREAALTSEIADRQAHFDRERAQAESERASLTEQLRAVAEARDQARQAHQSAVAEVASLTEREVVLTSELADRQAHFDREQAQGESARADLAAQLRDVEAARTNLTAQLRAVEEARDQARREHQSAVTEIAALTGREADLTSELADVWAAERTLEVRLAEVVRASSDAAERAAAEREAAAECQADLEARLSRADETMEGLRQALAETRAAALDAERLLTEEAEALRAAALVQAVRFEDRFDEQRRAYESRLAEGQAERREIEARFEAARRGLQDSLDRLTREHAEALATHESTIEELRVSSRADNHRLFQQASLPMFRCTKDGALTQANRMLTALVGLRSTDELGGADFAASVFESPNDLSWLIERCLGSRGKEVTETTWRRKDGTRLLVRLSACATSADLIECGVEDLTPVRVLQDRLSQAHRMEAVGRLAAEVAVTCGNLLRGVHQNTQEWLMTDGSHAASRQRGEMLLEEMSRAAGLLSQLAAYGNEESRRPAAVELNAVVRDMAPVLKRVAGDAVEVQFPAASTRLNVDASAERIQRLLVNLAAYGRERMPRGGRLKIEVGTIVVDRHFTAKHPNVRLGPHALVTVTESRRTTQTGGPLELHEGEAGSQGSVAVQPTVDLGTLQELVGECGGHLWMTVQPLGDMVVKIRLPLLTSYGQPAQPASAAGGRVRAIASWFQH